MLVVAGGRELERITWLGGGARRADLDPGQAVGFLVGGVTLARSKTKSSDISMSFSSIPLLGSKRNGA